MMEDRSNQDKHGDIKQQLQEGQPGWMRWVSLLMLLAAMAFAMWMWGPWGEGAQQVTIEYSTFRQQVRDGNVSRITMSGEEIQGTLEEPAEKDLPEGEPIEYTDFVTYLPATGDDELLNMLEDHDVALATEPSSGPSPLLTILLNLAPFLLLLLIAIPFIRRMQNQGQDIFSFRQSRAQRYDRTKQEVTFNDVAGLEGAKTELTEIIEFLKNPEGIRRLGGEMPKGVLLLGPPGTGKTLLARATAGEAEVPFFNITGSDFMEMFVGVGASRVRDLFDEAKKVSPSVIFIDELDSIGRRRGAGLGGGHDEREQTLNQLLSELDGFQPKEDVVVMGATNRPDILDPALLRPGRFDRQITVNSPAMKDRIKILEIHSRDKPLDQDVDLERLARGTPGFSGADLENLLNEAALLAARKGKEVIEQEDIEEARDKVLMGLEREGLSLSDDELQTLSYHEAGHAVVAAVLPQADPIHKVTIIPRGKAMGVTQQLPEKDKYIYARPYLLDRLAVMMGGRAAEDLVMGTSTSGAENDLKQATKLARKMVLDWGMSERLGSVALGGAREHVFLGEEISQRKDYSEATAREVDQEIKSILDHAFDRASSTLEEHREGLDQLAEELLEREEIPGDEVLEIIGVGEGSLEP